MGLTRFVLAVHCHQPVGNFGWVLEEAYRTAYLPFLEILEKHPKVPVVFHFSGTLLDWFEDRRPEFLKRLRNLVRRGQVEFMGGGYYEPILPMVPEPDAVGQLSRMNRMLQRLGLDRSDARPGLRTQRRAGGKKGGEGITGAWLAERVWEATLPSLFGQAGIRYTVVDDRHLERAGVKEEDRFGFFLTEDRGHPLALFPSSKRLRYLVPFKPVEEVIRALEGYRSDDPKVVVLADDGEKFGLWPGTHAWVYQEGWLENFFRELERHSDWLKMMTFRQCLKTLPPLGKVYLSYGSYEEMDDWSGGFFRNFLRKYPEADAMHKKMLWISNRLREFSTDHGPRTTNSLFNKARQHLYMAQCNDAYWHGIFGGLYLRHLRRGIWQQLLESERILDQRERKRDWVKAEALDIDADQEPELLLRSESTTLLLDSNRGGQMLEWSDKELGLNLLDTLTRRAEPYHERLRQRKELALSSAALEEGSASRPDLPVSIHERQEEAGGLGLADLLVVDRYRRAGWMDRLFPLEEDVHSVARGGGREMGDFVEGPYEGTLRRQRDSVQAVLTRRGRVRIEGVDHPLTLKKTVTLPAKGRAITVTYQWANASAHPVSFLFGSETNLALKDAHVNRIGQARGIRRFSVTDPAARLSVGWAFSRPAQLWHFPLETVSDSERGMERTYQGVSLTFLWPLTLSGRGSWQVRWEVRWECC